jgi:hypothetical protein
MSTTNKTESDDAVFRQWTKQIKIFRNSLQNKIDNEERSDVKKEIKLLLEELSNNNDAGENIRKNSPRHKM